MSDLGKRLVEGKTLGYIAGYNKKTTEIYADSLYDAKKKAIAHFKVPKSKQSMVWVSLAEKDGKAVKHVATESVITERYDDGGYPVKDRWDGETPKRIGPRYDRDTDVYVTINGKKVYGGAPVVLKNGKKGVLLAVYKNNTATFAASHKLGEPQSVIKIADVKTVK